MQDRAERRAIVELARLGNARRTAEFPRRVEVDDQRGRRSPRAQLREAAARKFVRTRPPLPHHPDPCRPPHPHRPRPAAARPLRCPRPHQGAQAGAH